MEGELDRKVPKENLKWLEGFVEHEEQLAKTREITRQRRREIIDYLESKGYRRDVIYLVLKRCML